MGERDAKKSLSKTDSVSITHILQNSESYRDKSVTISGSVTAGMAFEFVNEQPYLLNDGTGEIWVITSGTMPEEDSEIKVMGKVMVPYQIKGRHYKIAILEIQRLR